MTQSISNLNRALQFEKAIAWLERLLAEKPEDQTAIRKLVTRLDGYLPDRPGFGPYTDCQRALVESTKKINWVDNARDSRIMIDNYKKWLGNIGDYNESIKIPVNQIFSGNFVEIDGKKSYCTAQLSLFKNEGVIPKVCGSCYKVQILPLDLVTLMQIHFILRGLELPRDNCRKCMVELRGDIPYPYKGYIYCESEAEAENCLEQLRCTLEASDISNVICGISHGCSEYGLKYPEFKYSSDGTHHSFERPASWDQAEAAFWSSVQLPQRINQDHNKEGISIRDMVAFRTWIDYAEIIGDDSWKRFRGTPSTSKPASYTAYVSQQTQHRRAELEELRQRASSAA